MSLYEEIKRSNIKPLKLLQTFDNNISLNNEKRGSTKFIYDACLIIRINIFLGAINPAFL